jgi:hypothetical protein
MKVLFVAMPGSIHTARWIAQLREENWDIHLFPSIPDQGLHAQLANVKVYDFYPYLRAGSPAVPVRTIIPSRRQGLKLTLSRYPLLQKVPSLRPRFIKPDLALAQLIGELQPDIVHSLEFQAAGYLTLEARKRFKGPFPKWIATNWGSDIYLFGKLEEHRAKIREVLGACDYYSCECQRDVLLAKELGFSKVALPVYPNTGGFDLGAIEGLRQPGPPSGRRLIMLKGYQTWAGRALTALRALERCADLLRDGGYQVAVYVPVPDVELAARVFTANTGVPIRIIPAGSDHLEILRLHGQARISIGLSISDAISTSFLEAMAMGSFPVQSWTSCANEWVADGETGFLVPPEDPEVVEQAIRKALTDDALVDRAAEANYQTIAGRAEYQVLRRKTIDMYQYVYHHSPQS